jgi:hypothetical protein
LDEASKVAAEEAIKDNAAVAVAKDLMENIIVKERIILKRSWEGLGR